MSIWKTKGMNRDLSASAFNAEFAFENINLRLSTNENNTLMSWVTEKGTSAISLSITTDPWNEHSILEPETTIKGTPVGTAIINHKLVLFTTTAAVPEQIDRIYVLKYSNPAKTAMSGIVLFKGNLNFNTGYPLETHVSYEAEYVQKVYWTDGYNQPRLINIVADAEKLYRWNHTTDSHATFFDFVPAVKLNETMTITKDNIGGVFASGVIQYCFTYINKYGQQSNVIDVSPLQYLSFSDRGGSPEEKVPNCFHIRIDNVDSSFDSVRIYAIQRTSLDTEAYVRLIEDLPIQSENLGTSENPDINYYVSIVDTGTTGTMLDPTELLYVGGREITALTMTDKDNTLFMGNIVQKNVDITLVQKYYDDNRETDEGGTPVQNTFGIEFKQDAINASNPIKTITVESGEGYTYSHTQQLNESQRQITTFKGGETYRLGFQLQKYTGEWTEPIFLNDIENNLYPIDHIGTHGGVVPVETRDIRLAYAETEIDFTPFITAPTILEPNQPYYMENFQSIYKRVRPVIVFPDIQSRTVLCQGVINPTVFNVEDRMDNTPFAQASWYFRPYTKSNVEPVIGTSEGLHVGFGHYRSIGESEIQGYLETVQDNVGSTPYGTILDDIYVNGTFICNNTFFVDQSIVTLNSPDLEFDTKVQVFGNNGLKLRIIGLIPITANTSSHEITALSGMLELGHNRKDTEIIISGNVPYIVKHDKENIAFGAGELAETVSHVNYTAESGRHLLAAYLWNDSFTMPGDDGSECKDGDDVYTSWYAYDFAIYPWHRSGSLNNDWRPKESASSWLMTKKESNSLYSAVTDYLQDEDANHTTHFINYPKLDIKTVLTENAQVVNYRLQRQTSVLDNINYYPNIDKVLYAGLGYPIGMRPPSDNDNPILFPQTEIDARSKKVNSPISMKYKSTTHAVIALQADTEDNGYVPIMPYIQSISSTIGATPSTVGQFTHEKGTTYWLPTTLPAKELGFWNCANGSAHPQPKIETSWQETSGGSTTWHARTSDGYDVLLLGELYRDNVENRFGGTSEEELGYNTWLPAGAAVEIPWGDGADDNKATIRWTEGDTYYQRYDCLKTYAFTQDDPNQIVEMLSFMCETHVNIDGRYDKQRGQKYMHEMDPSVFNLLNPVYSQTNNFFPYKMLEHDAQDEETYPNQIYFTKAKENGADVDLYTNVTLASMLELDGDKGEITSLQNMNNNLLAFQDTGIAQILYNENVQISTQQGVPIELANSGKVQGKKYITDTVGCSNKWSIVNTPSGLYFMDSHNKDIYMFNGQLNNLSFAQGFNTWTKANIKLPNGNVDKWTPDNFDNFVSYFDKLNQDVLFINKSTALAYSERVGTFTSFYDYGNTPYLCNLDGTGVWVRGDGSLHKHQAGNYCQFFGTNKPYSMTLVGNPEPQLDKIFTNLEFRAIVDGDGTNTSPLFSPFLPFDYLEAWNEYQHGKTDLETKNGYSGRVHLPHLPSPTGSDPVDYSSALKRKFRIWRCDIPRDNAPLTMDTGMNISRFAVRPLDRIRNPWAYLKLQKNAASSGTLPRTEIHDIMLGYHI